MTTSSEKLTTLAREVAPSLLGRLAGEGTAGMMAAAFMAPFVDDPAALDALATLDPAEADRWLSEAIAFLASLRSDDAPELAIVGGYGDPAGWRTYLNPGPYYSADPGDLVTGDAVRGLVGSGAHRGEIGNG